MGMLSPTILNGTLRAKKKRGEGIFERHPNVFVDTILHLTATYLQP